MASRSVRRDQQVIDPMFYIPEGVDELVYPDESVLTDVSDEAGVDVEALAEDFDTDFENSDIDYADNPDTPQILGVESYSIRMSDDGSEVVDIVLNVEEIENTTKYEFRVTKI